VRVRAQEGRRAEYEKFRSGRKEKASQAVLDWEERREGEKQRVEGTPFL
jgi:hypothetical protein